MAKTRRMMKANLKKEMKKHKIRKCSVKLTLLTTKNNSAFRKALFRMHGIRDCTVKLHRLDNESFVVVSKPAKKKLLSTPKAKSVRFQVPWLPTIADVTLSSRIKETPKSAGKRSELSCDVTGCNDAINSPESSKPQKTKLLPMLEEWPKPTNEDFHSELLKKLNSPNRSLLPVGHRSIPDLVPETVPEYQKIFEEFKKKLAERKGQQNEGK